MATCPTCKTCRLWDRDRAEPDEAGVVAPCLLNPPVPVVVDGEVRQVRSMTSEADVCGHHPGWDDHLHRLAAERGEQRQREIEARVAQVSRLG